MKKIIELAEKLANIYGVEPISTIDMGELLCVVSDMTNALVERKELERTPIAEEWLKEHGFVDEPHERMLIYRKGYFGIECNLSSWEWYWANGDVLLNSLADLYDACELCGIELE